MTSSLLMGRCSEVCGDTAFPIGYCRNEVVSRPPLGFGENRSRRKSLSRVQSSQENTISHAFRPFFTNEVAFDRLYLGWQCQQRSEFFSGSSPNKGHRMKKVTVPGRQDAGRQVGSKETTQAQQDKRDFKLASILLPRGP